MFNSSPDPDLSIPGLMCTVVPFTVTPQPYKDRGSVESDKGKRKACRFERKWLGSCSGLEDEHYGFKDGRPCVIVKLNRIVNFRPRVGVLRTHYNITITLKQIKLLKKIHKNTQA